VEAEGEPVKVRVHDFLIPGQGRASPYGVYDVAHQILSRNGKVIC